MIDTVTLEGLEIGTGLKNCGLADAERRKCRSSYQWKACGK